jgi:hypothetical protein
MSVSGEDDISIFKTEVTVWIITIRTFTAVITGKLGLYHYVTFLFSFFLFSSTGNYMYIYLYNTIFVINKQRLVSVQFTLREALGKELMTSLLTCSRWFLAWLILRP